MNQYICLDLASKTKPTKTPDYLVEKNDWVRPSERNDVCSICHKIYHLDNLILCDYCLDANRCINCIKLLEDINPDKVAQIIEDYEYYSQIDNRIKYLFINSIDDDDEPSTFCVKCWKKFLSVMDSEPELKAKWLSLTY